MGRKIFASYKYGDRNIRPIPYGTYGLTNPQGIARDYVRALDNIYAVYGNISKAEKEEDLSQFKDETIKMHLKDLIYDSSITIVLVSPNMNTGEPEDAQWIPWEIEYSLRTVPRNGRISQMNALLAVVLPDFYNSYSYFFQYGTCGCEILNADILFPIMSKNMFNIWPAYRNPGNCRFHPASQTGPHSYIPFVKWDDFVESPPSMDKHLLEAEKRRDAGDSYYDIKRSIESAPAKVAAF